MTNPAEPADIVSRWRPLTPSELLVATTRLDDAWRKLMKAIPDLVTRMATDDDLTEDVVRVLADSVIRVLQVLERGGLRKGSIGVDDANRSWELDDAIRNGLYFTDDELADLRPGPTGRRKAFSVMPS